MANQPRAELFSLSLKASNPASINQPGTMDLVPAVGIFHRDSIIYVETTQTYRCSYPSNPSTTAEQAFLEIFSRSDMCANMFGATCTVTVDGNPTHNFINLGVAQWQYYQKFLNPTFGQAEPSLGVYDTTQLQGCGVSFNASKQLQKLASVPLYVPASATLAAQTVDITVTISQAFKLHHFIPFLFAAGQEYIQIPNDFQISLNNVQLPGFILRGVVPIKGTTSQSRNYSSPGGSITILLGTSYSVTVAPYGTPTLKLKSELISATGIAHNPGFRSGFMQKRFQPAGADGSPSCNDNFKVPPKAVSMYQTVALIQQYNPLLYSATDGAYTVVKQAADYMTFDEFPIVANSYTPSVTQLPTIAPTQAACQVQVQKDNLYLVNASSQTEAIRQFQLSNFKSGNDTGTMSAVYEQLFENYTISHNINVQIPNTILYVGYQYEMHEASVVQ